MKTNVNKLKLILPLAGSLFWTVSTRAQASNDTCLSYEELDFFIGQSFTCAEQKVTIATKDNTISDLYFTVVEQKDAIAEFQHNLQLQIEETKNCETDSKADKQTIKTLTRKVKVNKVGLWVFGILSIGEGGALLLKK
jgi:uncharacterized coiled-coil protein SlyX